MTTARWWALASPGLVSDRTALQQTATLVGRPPGTATWYAAWSYGSPFPTAAADALRTWGAIPQVTWEPWDPTAGVTQPAYTLARITAGDFDAYITSWARDIKAWGHWLRIRFAHEMNGNWYPWAEGVNGNRSGDYVKAWWHVRSIFDRLGVTNVGWVWCPQAPYPGTVPLPGLFPGDGGVNEVALDGYNWHVQPTDPWTPFASVFGPGINQLAALSKQPVSIGETGCPETGGDKATWITGMWQTLAGWPQVRGLLWFDFQKEADWRINSSPASLAAFQAGLPGYLRG